MQKHFAAGVKEWLLIVAGAILLLAALLLPLTAALADGLTAEEETLMEAFRSGEIIRIHVIASSDSEADQALKLKVRDALIEAFGQLLRQAGEESGEAVYRLLQENRARMQQIAQQCAIQNGFEGTVRAEVGILALPPKQYGRVVLPGGEYRALRIVLGEGRGRNWWCVLYPQLCLALAETNDPAGQGLLWSSDRIFRCWLLTGQ